MAKSYKKGYMKQRRRLQSLMSSAKKRGYIFDKPSIIGTIPKNPSLRDINRLRRITPEEFYKRVEYLLKATGEVIPGVAGKAHIKMQRAKAKELAKNEVNMGHMALRKFYLTAQSLRSPEARGILYDFISDLVEAHGADSVGKMLGHAEQAGISPEALVYPSNQEEAAIKYVDAFCEYAGMNWEDNAALDEALEDDGENYL